MALIAMAVWDTEQNNRTRYTERTLISLCNTVDLSKHRIIVVDNSSCQATKDILGDYLSNNIIQGVISLTENIGTARGINKAWSYRKTQEHCVKMDNDVVIHHPNWADELEEVLNLSERLPTTVGLLCLKRKDLFEDVYRNDSFKSELVQLPHEKGERWWTIEKVNHCIGTVQMYHHRLIDKIGGLEQMEGLYAFDDSIASLKSQLAGYINAFLPHIHIDHIDTAESKEYQQWKIDYANEMFPKFHELVDDYKSGVRDLYTPIE